MIWPPKPRDGCGFWNPRWTAIGFALFENDNDWHYNLYVCVDPAHKDFGVIRGFITDPSVLHRDVVGSGAELMEALEAADADDPDALLFAERNLEGLLNPEAEEYLELIRDGEFEEGDADHEELRRRYEETRNRDE